MLDASPFEDTEMGETPSLSTLYAKYSPFVHTALRRLGVGPDAVEDAAQEVFVVALRRSGSLSDTLSARGWLYGVAKRIAMHHRRGLARRDRVRTMFAAQEQNPGPDLEAVVERRESWARVREVLAGLDRKKRLVLILSDIEGLSGPEIADALQENINAIYARIRAARRAFDVAMRRQRLRLEREAAARSLPNRAKSNRRASKDSLGHRGARTDEKIQRDEKRSLEGVRSSRAPHRSRHSVWGIRTGS